MAVAGGKQIGDPDSVTAMLDKAKTKYADIVLVHGGGPGVEKIAARWAERHSVHQIVCKPDWTAHGRAAPFRRNDDLLNLLPKGLIAFPRLRHHRQPGRQSPQAGYSGTAGYAELSRSASRAVSYHRRGPRYFGVVQCRHQLRHHGRHRCRGNCALAPAPVQRQLRAIGCAVHSAVRRSRRTGLCTGAGTSGTRARPPADAVLHQGPHCCMGCWPRCRSRAAAAPVRRVRRRRSLRLLHLYICAVRTARAAYILTPDAPWAQMRHRYPGVLSTTLGLPQDTRTMMGTVSGL